MPWNEIGQALRRIGYDKAVVMEPFVLTGGEVGRDIKVWREMNRDSSIQRLDFDAKQSVLYLRSVFSGPSSDWKN